MGKLLEDRRKTTAARIGEIQQKITDADHHCGEIACVYVTGSFARGEASKHSDLDLFIVGDNVETSTGPKRALSKLNEIIVKADLIDATRALGFPEFSGDGEYLEHCTVNQLVATLGKPEDDVTNTFTARLLLLLESSPLVGKAAYHKFTEAVVSAYWRDYEGHKSDFMPAFLANDILRMWRTFCVNYEARTQSEPAAEKAKRKLKNYKLKHSRLLTCYSALLYLAAIYSRNHTVSPADVLNMISLTPTKRVEWLLSQADFEPAHHKLKELIALYERFLESTDASKEELVERFLDREKSKVYTASANEFGDVVFSVLESIGNKNPFYRLMVV